MEENGVGRLANPNRVVPPWRVLTLPRLFTRMVIILEDRPGNTVKLPPLEFLLTPLRWNGNPGKTAWLDYRENRLGRRRTSMVVGREYLGPEKKPRLVLRSPMSLGTYLGTLPPRSTFRRPLETRPTSLCLRPCAWRPV